MRGLFCLAVLAVGCVESKPDDPEGVDARGAVIEESGLTWAPGSGPSADVERCDGQDNDGDGIIDETGGGGGGWLDRDGDGFGDPDGWRSWVCVGPHVADNGEDCDDARSDIHPGAVETCGQGDLNCDGEAVSAYAVWVDADGDGWYAPDAACHEDGLEYIEVVEGGLWATDCDDTEALAFPGAEEVCGDGIVNDCETFTEDLACLDAADCPSFWPIDTTDGQVVHLRDGADWLTFSTAGALGSQREVDTYSWVSEASYVLDGDGELIIATEQEAWTLACTEAGVVRLSGTTEDHSYTDGWDRTSRTEASFATPPVALPTDLEEGTSWTEVGIRHGRDGDDVWGLTTAQAGFSTVHTVESCATQPVHPTGNRTVCTISAIDDSGRSWHWEVAEGLGPIGIDGAERLWVDQP